MNSAQDIVPPYLLNEPVFDAGGLLRAYRVRHSSYALPRYRLSISDALTIVRANGGTSTCIPAAAPEHLPELLAATTSGASLLVEIDACHENAHSDGARLIDSGIEIVFSNISPDNVASFSQYSSWLIVKAGLSAHQLKELATNLPATKRLIAPGLEQWQQRDEALFMGCTHVSGKYIHTQRQSGATRRPSSTMIDMLRLIEMYGHPGMRASVVFQTLTSSRDVSDIVLRMAGSPPFGDGVRFRDLAQLAAGVAVTNVQRMIMIALVWMLVSGLSVDGEDETGYLFRAALARAHMCEAVAASLEHGLTLREFTSGLLSFVPHLLGVCSNDLSEVMPKHGSHILSDIIAYESGQVAMNGSNAVQMRLFNSIYLESLHWARDVSSLLFNPSCVTQSWLSGVSTAEKLALVS